MSDIYKTHVPQSGGGGLYLKITDGQTVKLRIVSEPAIFESESQPDEQGHTRISTRYGWLVWNQDEQTPQILQQSATFFKQLAGLAQDDEYGDPTGYDIKVKRDGNGLDTTYMITPSANRDPLGANAQKELRLSTFLKNSRLRRMHSTLCGLMTLRTNQHQSLKPRTHCSRRLRRL